MQQKLILSRWPSGLRRQGAKRKVTGSIPGLGICFYFKFIPLFLVPNSLLEPIRIKLSITIYLLCLLVQIPVTIIHMHMPMPIYYLKQYSFKTDSIVR